MAIKERITCALRWIRKKVVRAYKLELCSNQEGRFLLCSVLSAEEKRFLLVFPEGRGFLGGWKIIANKLRIAGVALLLRIVEAPWEAIKQLEDSGRGLF